MVGKPWDASALAICRPFVEVEGLALHQAVWEVRYARICPHPRPAICFPHDGPDRKNLYIADGVLRNQPLKSCDAMAGYETRSSLRRHLAWEVRQEVYRVFFD